MNFVLNNIDHFRKKSADLQDFSGKWLVLDFWSSTCSSCIAGFAKINKFQQEFGDRVQFVLVGKNDSKYNKGIRSLYEKVRVLQHLELPAAYDTVIFKQLNVILTPQILIIDPQGVIKGITYGSELKESSIEALLSGRVPDMVMINPDDYSASVISPDVSELTGVRNNNKELNGSVLSPWTKSNPLLLKFVLYADQDSGSYQGGGLSLKRLYNMAYFGATDWGISNTSLYGKVWREPVLELKDTSVFKNDFRRQKGLFNYTLKVPIKKASKAYMQYAMQCDLKKYFGYRVHEEQRMMPCWELHASEETLFSLKNKGSKKIECLNPTGFKIRNAKIGGLIKMIWSYNTLSFPIIDQTGFKSAIDLEIHADMLSFQDVRSELGKKGLRLVKRMRLMKVLVITD